jgi:plastocyanin
MDDKFAVTSTLLITAIIVFVIVAVVVSALFFANPISKLNSTSSSQDSNKPSLDFSFPGQLLASPDISQMNYSLTISPPENSDENLSLLAFAPLGLSAAFSPSSVSLTGLNASSVLALSVSQSTEPGEYYIILEEQSQGSSYNETISVLVLRYLVVTINTTFVPSSLTVVLNSVVTWLRLNGALSQVDDGAHDIDFSSGISAVSPTLNQYQTWNYTFTQPGNYDYYCKYHPFMTGDIQVSSS